MGAQSARLSARIQSATQSARTQSQSASPSAKNQSVIGSATVHPIAPSQSALLCARNPHTARNSQKLIAVTVLNMSKSRLSQRTPSAVVVQNKLLQPSRNKILT